MLNHVVLQGRLTSDPILRYTLDNVAVANFSLAVARNYVGKDSGERPTDFIEVVAWRGYAEFVSHRFKKGMMVLVEGSIEVEDWIDQDGSRRRSWRIRASDLYFGEPKQKEDKPVELENGHAD